MKKFGFVLIGCFLMSCSLYAQTDKVRLSAIDKEKNAIKTNINNYQKTVVVSDSTGYRYDFTKDNKLQLVMVEVKDKGVDKKVEWYFSNGKMIYAEQNWVDMKSKNIVDNEKSYLSNGQMIAWFENNNKESDPSSDKFKEAAAGLEKEENTLLAKYSK